MAKAKPQFRMLKNGYDRFAVDDAINDYQAQVEMMEKQLELANNQMTTIKEQLDQYKIRYQTLSSELAMKEKAADDISRLALKEANTIIQTAHNNATLIVQEALSTARSVLVELANVSKGASGLKKDMRYQLESLMKNIDEFELPPIPDMSWLDYNEKQ